MAPYLSVREAGQKHENSRARVVLVCKPSLPKAMGALHPAGALYARPVNLQKAISDHDNFVALLRRRGVTVLELSEVLCDRLGSSVGDRVALEDLAANNLIYEYGATSGACETSVVSTSGSGSGNDNSSVSEYDGILTDTQKFFMSDEYKRSVLAEMTPQQLVDVILTNPRVTITPVSRDTGFTCSYNFEPLSNILFVRDQQITTRKGIVMARLTSPQREKEVDILEFMWKKLGCPVIGRIPEGGYLEGGDFFPVGQHLSLIGVGPRSNFEAVDYLMSNDLPGTERVGVVKDEMECSQERMHLDTIFNIIGDKCALMLKDIMGIESSTRRMVDVYVRKGPGKYEMEAANIEFSHYVKETLGFNIIEVSSEEQLKYGCNVLNLGNGCIVSTEKNTARRISTSPHFTGTVEYLEFDGVTSMYGGVHCASQVVVRTTSE